MVCLGAYFGLGRLNGGLVTSEELTGTMDTVWTFVTFTDTVELGSGDTAVFLMNSGNIGGPIQPTSGWFDGVGLSTPQGIEEHPGLRIQHFPDPARDVVQVSACGAAIQRVDIHDMQGRVLATFPGVGRGSLPLHVHGLASGPHVAVVWTAQGPSAFRFIKE
jgi:hypothetical protein